MDLYYLRIEGINLSSVLYDTPQISVIRGASYLLRNATTELPELIKQYSQSTIELEPVSTGASVGLYRCMTNNHDALVKGVENILKHHDQYRYFTFVVDAVKASESYTHTLEELVALNRWQQMQSPSLSLQDLNKSSTEPCSWNGILPSDHYFLYKNDNKQSVSKSVHVRFMAGRELRSSFYTKEAGEEFSSYQFTDDLHQLSGFSDKHNLNEKIAVIYVDGNRFGKLQREQCKTEESLKNFDETMRGFRKEYLADFLRYIQNHPEYNTADHKLRLEILLWGGDEILLVVPAWCGLDALSFFFEKSRHWTFNKLPLTHSAGIVFSHDKTPIKRLSDLAKDLAENVKDELPNQSPIDLHAMRNGFDYLVLESVDYPTESLTAFRTKVFQEPLIKIRKTLAPPDCHLLQRLTNILTDIPKGQCHTLVKSIIQEQSLSGRAEQALLRLQAVTEKDQINKLQGVLAENLQDIFEQNIRQEWQWIHLLELWDYFPGRSVKGVSGA